MKQAPISVIIPIFNATQTLERAINSILTQTLLPKEVILVDDASKDCPCLIIEKYRESFKNSNINFIFLKNEINKGAGFSRNAGWEKATQDYLAFLDADDSWDPKKLEIQFQFMKEHKELMISAHRISLKNHLKTNQQAFFYVTKRTFLSLLFKTGGATPTLMVKRNAKARFGLFKTSEDRYLILCLAKVQKNLPIIEEALAYVYKPFYKSDGLSSSLWEGLKGDQEVFNALKNENIINFFLWFLASTFNFFKLLKRLLPYQNKTH